MTYTYDEDCYSDLHKDAFGFRPGQGNWELWNASTPAEKQERWDHLIEVMKRRGREEDEREQESIEQFEEHVASVCKGIGKDRATVIRWMFDAQDVNGDWDYWCYNLGVPDGYFKEFYMKEVAQ